MRWKAGMSRIGLAAGALVFSGATAAHAQESTTSTSSDDTTTVVVVTIAAVVVAFGLTVWLIARSRRRGTGAGGT